MLQYHSKHPGVLSVLTLTLYFKNNKEILIMKQKSIGYYLIASAVIWGAVIVGCAFKLKGTACYDEISLILYGGVVCHLLLIWAPLGTQFLKNKE